MKLFQKLVKPFSVLRHIYAVCTCSEYIYAVFTQKIRKLYSCSAAECHNNTVRIFGFYNIHYILFCKRLKIKPVRSIEVGRNRFGVIVYNYNFIAFFLQCPNAMNGRIVKFDTLTDSYRTGTENDNRLFARIFFRYKFRRLVFVVIRRIEIRS